jgi:hypothetical protein
MKNWKKIICGIAVGLASFGVFQTPANVRVYANGILEKPVVSVATKDELKEITRPYLGFYECKKLFFGKKNILKQFKYITVELTAGGEMVLRYKLKSGKKGESRCNYAYDEKSGKIAVTSEKGLMGLSCDVTLQKGKMTVFSRFGNKNLVMQLEQK